MADVALSKIHTIAANFTRPADTNAYTAGDVVNNSTSAPVILTFSRATAGANSSAMLQMATCVTSANVAVARPDLQLWLFDATVVMDNDNDVFTPTDAEMRTLLAIISFPTASFVIGDATAGAGGNAVCNAQSLWIPINTLPGDNAIYGVTVVRNAYVPTSSERFDFRLAFVE